MTEQVEKKRTKVQNAMWNFCKGVLAWGTYIGAQVLLVSALSAGVSSGLFTVGFALMISVILSAMIHMFVLFSSI